MSLQTRRIAPVLLSALLSALLLAFTGCSSNSEAPPSDGSLVNNAAPASFEATNEISERSSTAAAVTPPKGMGNAQGRVFWNEKPASNIKVTLCETISFIGGCSGKSFSARSDKEGNYTIDKIPPDDYGLAVQIFDTDNFVYPTTGIISAAKFKVTANETLDIRATNLYKLDLQITSPKAGETIPSGMPKLTWKPYADAKTYEVTVSAAGTGTLTQNLVTSETSVSPETPLLNGSYQWDVVAKNANGIKIAATSSSTPFKVTGQSGSTKVETLAPKIGASVAGSGLKFKWAAHPLADRYQIYLSKANVPEPILSFQKIKGTQYSYAKTLGAGDYYWTIYAFRGVKQIAQSDISKFTVK